MSTKQQTKFSTEVQIPENVKVSFKKNMLNVEGPLGNCLLYTSPSPRD